MTDAEKTEVTTDEAALFRKLKAWFRKDREHSSKWRAEAKEDYAFVAGDQYTTDEIAHLKDQLRPIITFNRVDPLIRAVSGAEITSRQEVKYLPREMGDAKVNDVITNAASWFRDECDAEDEESDSFLDSAICGYGWTETRLDFDNSPDGDPLVDRVDPREMFADHSARKRNLVDGRRVSRARRITLSEAMQLFPKAERTDFGGRWADFLTDGEVRDQDEEDKYQPDGQGENSTVRDEDYVTVVEVQWWEKKPVYIAIDPLTGQEKEYTPDQNRRLTERFGMMGMQMRSIKYMKKVYKRAFLSDKLLGVEDGPCGDHFTYQAITAFRDGNKGTFYGLVRAMKDPQRWANKWMGQLLHIMNSTAKGGVLMEEDATDDQEAFEKSYARADAVTYVNKGAIANGKVRDKPGGQFPAGFYQMMEFAVSSVRDVTGVNLELLGMREAQQAASLEYQRRQASMTVLATLFDGLRRYRKNQGRVMLYLITTYLSDGRLIKIVGEDGAQYVPLVKQADVKYDIIVDEAPSAPNQKEMVWSFIGPMFPSLPPQIQVALLDYAPLPETVIEKLKAVIGKMGENPMAEKQNMMLEQRHQAEVGKIESETAENIAQTRKLGADTRVSEAQVLSQILSGFMPKQPATAH